MDVVHGRTATEGAVRRDFHPIDWAVALLAAWLFAGAYLDGWAHKHGKVESFFTPYHAVLYSGFMAAALFLALATCFPASAPRRPTFGALPSGYELSLAGALVFALGGAADLVWHAVFGIESSFAALVSPSHLVLSVGGVLIATGPLRAAWRHAAIGDNPAGLLAQFPMLLSAALLLADLTFVTQGMHPFGRTDAAGYLPAGIGADTVQELGVAGILLQTAFLMGVAFMVLAMRGWNVPFGAMTLIGGLPATLVVLMRDNALSTGRLPLIAAAVLAGLAADGMLAALRPSPQRPEMLRIWAFATPTILYALYFAAIAKWGDGIWWSVHVWAGAIVLAGVAGLLLSYLIVLPRDGLFPGTFTANCAETPASTAFE